jgi:hypothetical protein
MIVRQNEKIFVAPRRCCGPVKAPADEPPRASVNQHAKRLVVQQAAACMVGPAHALRRGIPNVRLVAAVTNPQVRQIQRIQKANLLAPDPDPLAPVRQNPNRQGGMPHRGIRQRPRHVLVRKCKRHHVQLDLMSHGQCRSFIDQVQYSPSNSIASFEAGEQGFHSKHELTKHVYRATIQRAIVLREPGPDLTAPHLTPIALRMQRRLFGFDKKQLTPVSDADMWRILRELRAASVLEPFRLWLVGSRRDDRGNESSDVDLILSPRAVGSFSDAAIERALWYCRSFGLYTANPRCVLDPCFRPAGPGLEIVPLRPDTVVRTFKLFSPRLARLVSEGRILRYRRVGRFSIEYLRRAQDTNYYGKLPTRVFDGSVSPYLRPAVEVPFISDPV